MNFWLIVIFDYWEFIISIWWWYGFLGDLAVFILWNHNLWNHGRCFGYLNDGLLDKTFMELWSLSVESLCVYSFQEILRNNNLWFNHSSDWEESSKMKVNLEQRCNRFKYLRVRPNISQMSEKPPNPNTIAAFTTLQQTIKNESSKFHINFRVRLSSWLSRV